MPNNNGKLTAPIGIASIAQCTGNPMMDLGFQCMDSKPYFRYVNGSNVVYTTIYPTRNAAAITAGTLIAYTLSSVIKDGITYNAMSYLGTITTATTTTITYNGTVYTWDNSYKVIRLFLVNKWSWFKPIAGFTQYEDLTDAQIKSVNDSMEIPTYQKAYDCLNGVLDGTGVWSYNAPVLGTDTFRLADFIGYDNGAASWFVFVASASQVEGGDRVDFTMDNMPLQFKSLVLAFGKWSAYTSATLDMGFLLRNVNSGASATNCIYYKIDTLADIDEGGSDHWFHMIVPDSTVDPDHILTVGSTYYIVPCVTSYLGATRQHLTYIDSNSTISGNWWALPVPNTTLKILSSGTSNLGKLSIVNSTTEEGEPYPYSVTFTYNESTYTFTMTSLTIRVNNSKSSAITATLRVVLKQTGSPNPVDREIWNSATSFASGNTDVQIVTGSAITWVDAIGSGPIEVTLKVKDTTSPIQGYTLRSLKYE
jgi:hypothetical protein